MTRGRLTRRGLLGGVAGAALLWPRVRATAAGPNDRGIGGTGATETPAGAPDRGIGGTGVIGTIRKFGSIVVNDLRIAYPADVPVVIDGKPGTAADLRIGHVVRTLAVPNGSGLATKMIAVTSEVVGPVEKVGTSKITVLGQDVSTAAYGRDHAWKAGEMVAVSGLRRPDGTIVASLIEAAPGAAPRVAGPVRAGADGAPMIGGLRLAGLAAGLDGQRALVEGRIAPGGAFAVQQANVDTLGFGPNVRNLSVEAYAARGNGGARLGSGLRVAGAAGGLPTNGATRVVLTGTAGADGVLDVTSVRRQTGASVPANAGAGQDGTRPGGGAGAPGAPRGGGGGGAGPRPGTPSDPTAPPSHGSSGGGAAPAPSAAPSSAGSPAAAPHSAAPPAPAPSGGLGGGGGGPRGGGRR